MFATQTLAPFSLSALPGIQTAFLATANGPIPYTPVEEYSYPSQTVFDSYQHTSPSSIPELSSYNMASRFTPDIRPKNTTPIMPKQVNENKSVTQLGMGILATLSSISPNAYTDISQNEVSTAIKLLSPSNIFDILKDPSNFDFVSYSSAFTKSFAEYLHLEQLQLIDPGQMNELLQLGLQVGAFAATNLASWFASGLAQKFVLNLINNSDLSEGKKHFLTQGTKAIRITFVAITALLVFLMVGGNATVLLASTGLVGLGLAVLAKQFFADFANYLRIKSTSNYRVGKYISIGGKRGYILYTNLTHTYLINFYDPFKVDPSIFEGAMTISGHPNTQNEINHSTDPTETPSPENLKDGEYPSSEIPQGANLEEIAKDRVPVTFEIPNAYLLAEPITHYKEKDIDDPKILEPHLDVLRPKKEPEENKAKRQQAKSNRYDMTYLDMHWMAHADSSI